LLPPVTQPDVLETFDLCIREARVRRRPRLLIAEANVPPAAGGLLRPYLLIPQDLLSQKDRLALRFILLHELAHLRNGDLFVNWVMLVLRALHWFNPAIWFAFGRIRADRELACDACVLSVTQTREHESYGHVLIDLVERLDGRRLSFETVGMSAAPALLKTRIRLISGYNRPRVWQSAVGIVLVLTLGLCGLTSARTAPEKEPTEPKPSATAPAASVAARYAKDLDLPKEITLNVACVAEDGRPIADAEVIVYEIDPWTLESKPAASQRTNSVGTCRFDKVPTADATINRVLRGPGNEVCSVAAKAAGRASAIRYLTTRNVADSAAMVALVMPRAQTLSGRVTDANGKPIRGASVYSRGAAWKQPVPGICFAKTDEGGYYEITDIGEWTPPPDAGQTHSQMINEKIGRSWVVPDYFVLYVHHPDYGLKQAECHRVPGVTKIQMEEPGILTGRVVDATTKQPLAGVSLFVEAQPPFKPYGCSWGVTDQNGAYRIAVAAKSDYYLFVSKDGFVPTKRSPRPTAIPANVATPVEDIEMVRTGTIRGHVVDRITKKPIRLSTKPAVNFVVRSSRDTPWGSEPFTTRIGSDGAFEQRAVHPSRTYSLSVESDDPTIKSHANIVETLVAPGETVEMDLPVTVNNSNR
jgi:hypothetical protein